MLIKQRSSWHFNVKFSARSISQTGPLVSLKLAMKSWLEKLLYFIDKKINKNNAKDRQDENKDLTNCEIEETG